MRLIDADKLKLSYWIPSGTSTVSTAGQYYFYSRAEIDEASTVDAEPIRHGHWEAFYAHEEPTSNVYRCSNCGKGFADYLDDDYDYYNEYPVFFEYDRCPHCGAIMDGDTVFSPYRSDGEYHKYWEEKDNGRT